jgi:hypothetical protein
MCVCVIFAKILNGYMTQSCRDARDVITLCSPTLFTEKDTASLAGNESSRGACLTIPEAPSSTL